MAINVILPQIGESVLEGTVTRWLKKPGDKVARDESLFEVSTDKVDTEIPSPADGILSRIDVQEGETVKVGTVVAILEEAGAIVEMPEVPSASPEPETGSVEPAPSEPLVPAGEPPAVEIEVTASELNPEPAVEEEAPAPAAPSNEPAVKAAELAQPAESAVPAAEVGAAEIDTVPLYEPEAAPAPEEGKTSTPEAPAEGKQDVVPQSEAEKPAEASAQSAEEEKTAPAPAALAEDKQEVLPQSKAEKPEVADTEPVGEEKTVPAPEAPPEEPASAGQVAQAETSTPTKEAEEQAVEEVSAGRHPVHVPRIRPGRIRTSPLVRRLAEENGIDLSQLLGTGLGGRITREDLFSYLNLHGWKSAELPASADVVSGEAGPSPGTEYTAHEAADVRELGPSASGGIPVPPPAEAAGTKPAEPLETSAPVLPETAPAPPPEKPAAPAGASRRPARREPAIPPSPRMVQPVGPPAAAAPASPGEASPYGETEIVTMTPMRKAISEHMVLSRRTSAHVQTVFEVDMSAVVALREKHMEEFAAREGFALTYTPFFVKALVDTVRDFPIMNSSVDGDTIVYKKSINVGIAVALETGLIVPVIRDAQLKSFTGLASAVHDLAHRARTKKLKPDEVQYGTISVTNHGIYGSLFGTPIISQPQVAILGVGTLEKRPVVIHDGIAIRTMVFLVLSFDHRVIDGAVADQFMSALKTRLQSWTDWME